MIKGIVARNNPLIEITVAGSQNVQRHVSLIDTGFTGELKLSEEKAEEIGLKMTHAEPVKLADGQIVQMRSSIAYVALEGIVRVVNVLISPGETIIGVGLMQKFQYALTIDFKYNSVVLQKSA